MAEEWAGPRRLSIYTCYDVAPLGRLWCRPHGAFARRAKPRRVSNVYNSPPRLRSVSILNWFVRISNPHINRNSLVQLGFTVNQKERNVQFRSHISSKKGFGLLNKGQKEVKNTSKSGFSDTLQPLPVLVCRGIFYLFWKKRKWYHFLPLFSPFVSDHPETEIWI